MPVRLARVKCDPYVFLMNTNAAVSGPEEARGGDWGKTLTADIARQVRRYREIRGMSTQALADACTAAGYPVKRSVLVNLENAVRSRPRDAVSVQIVLVLARVLDVPPVLLMVPVGAEQDVEILPGAFAGAWQAYEWIIGRRPLAQRWTRNGEVAYGVNLDATDTELLAENARPIELYGQHSQAQRDFAEWRPLDVNKAMDAVRSLVAVRHELRERGLDVPELVGAVGEAVAAQEGKEP